MVFARYSAAMTDARLLPSVRVCDLHSVSIRTAAFWYVSGYSAMPRSDMRGLSKAKPSWPRLRTDASALKLLFRLLITASI